MVNSRLLNSILNSSAFATTITTTTITNLYTSYIHRRGGGVIEDFNEIGLIFFIETLLKKNESNLIEIQLHSIEVAKFCKKLSFNMIGV